MSFEGPDVDSYGGDEDGHRKRDTSRKRDGKKDKKEKGYTMFEEEDSDGESFTLADDLKSPSKAKGNKAKPFKFPVRKEKVKEKEEKKDKDAKKEEKEKRREEKEGKKLKKDKKNSKLHEPPVANATPGDYENPIFGVPLAVAVERNKSHDGIELPIIVRECVDYIEECGLACEGIYRISGVKSKVQALKDSFNRHQPIYLYEHEPNIVASLLKQFLRDLPEPVLTTALMPKFEEASTAKSNKKKVELFSKIIQDLPVCNRLLLSWMIVHMSHVIDLAKENKMTLQNVSIVLSPTMRISHRVLNVLFSNTNALFGDVQLRKYVPPLRPANSKWSLELPDNLSSLEEELAKQESLLNQLHTDLNSGLTDPVIEEQLWEVQRVVTQLKRKIKLSKKGTEKSEGSITSGADTSKRLSNTSLPSLSAPEELRLDLKPVPVPKATAASSSTSVTTTVVVEPQQPAPKIEEKKLEQTVTLESAKTVKFVEKTKDVEAKAMETEKVEKETEKIRKKDDVDTKVDESSAKMSKKEEEKEEKDSLKKEEKNEDVKVEERKEEKPAKDEMKDNSQETDGEMEKGDNEVKKDVQGDLTSSDKKLDHDDDDDVVVGGGDDVKPAVQPKQDEKDAREPVQQGKGTPASASQHSKDERQEQPPKDTKGSNEKESKPHQEGSQPERGEIKQQKPDTKDTPIHKTDSVTHPPAPVPPFMSLTLLEPVKAEIPTRKKSESESAWAPEKENEEWRELEEELLGKKKEKAEKKKERAKKMQEGEDLSDDVSTDQLLEDEYALVMEEEELMAIADELRQKMATERSEMERLTQEIQELHYLRQDSDLEDMSSDSNSSDESEDEDDLQDLLSQLLQDNQNLETQNAEMCQKIHEERMICLSVKLQIRLLQQKQLEASCG